MDENKLKCTAMKTDQESIPHSGADPDSRKQQFRILVAEDYPINQVIFKSFISKAGFSADIVENGREAVLALEKKSYDLVLMDIEMPIMDGFDAARKIHDPHSRVLNHNVTIIAVSAHSGKEDIQKCNDAGMDGHLSKPLNPEALETLLNKYFIEKESLIDMAFVHAEPAEDVNPASEPFEESEKGLKESPVGPVFDKHELLYRVRGDKQFFKEMLEMFFNLAPAEIKKLKNLLQDNDIEQTRKQAHKLKGTFSNIAAHSLCAIALEIETAARHDEMGKARNSFKKMEVEFINCLKVMQENQQ